MLSPLPMSPIFREFRGVLREPDPEDRDWLLLPALLLDERAAEILELVRAAPDIYPGFYTFPTPAKRRKRALLRRSMRALDRTVGRTLLDDRTCGLLKREDRGTEEELLREPTHPADRIGVGLALGLFRRSRRRAAFRVGQEPFEGDRGAVSFASATIALEPAGRGRKCSWAPASHSSKRDCFSTPTSNRRLSEVTCVRSTPALQRWYNRRGIRTEPFSLAKGDPGASGRGSSSDRRRKYGCSPGRRA